LFVIVGTANIARVAIESHRWVAGTYIKLGSSCWHS